MEEENFEQYFEELVESIIRTGNFEGLKEFVKLQAGIKSERLRSKAIIFKKVVDMVIEEHLIDTLSQVFRSGSVFEFFDNEELFEMVKNSVKNKYNLAVILVEFKQYHLAKKVIRELDSYDKVKLARRIVYKRYQPVEEILPEIADILNTTIEKFLSSNYYDKYLVELRREIIEYIEHYSIQEHISNYKYLIRRIAEMLNNNELNNLHISHIKFFIKLVQKYGYEVNGLAPEIIKKIADYDSS